MNLKKEEGKWRMTLKGEVVSPDAYTAQASFNRFYQGLRGSTYLEGVELLPLNVSVVKEKVEVPGKNAPEVPVATGEPAEAKAETKKEEREIKKTKVEFEIRAHAKES
jgi:hypothetical protein